MRRDSFQRASPSIASRAMRGAIVRVRDPTPPARSVAAPDRLHPRLSAAASDELGGSPRDGRGRSAGSAPPRPTRDRGKSFGRANRCSWARTRRSRPGGARGTCRRSRRGPPLYRGQGAARDGSADRGHEKVDRSAERHVEVLDQSARHAVDPAQAGGTLRRCWYCEDERSPRCPRGRSPGGSLAIPVAPAPDVTAPCRRHHPRSHHHSRWRRPPRWRAGRR